MGKRRSCLDKRLSYMVAEGRAFFIRDVGNADGRRMAENGKEESGSGV